MKKKTPIPFAGLHHDYDDSLTEVLEAYGLLAVTVDTALKLGQVTEAVRPELSKAVARCEAAMYGAK